MAESMKPVAWVGVVDTYAGPYSFHGIEYMPKGQWELFTAAQLEQAIEPYKKAADSLSKYVLCQKKDTLTETYIVLVVVKNLTAIIRIRIGV